MTIIFAVLFAVIGLSWCSGWLLGILANAVLKAKRENYYAQLLAETAFSKKHYSQHALVVILVIGVSFLIPSLFPQYVKLTAVFLAYFWERGWFYLDAWLVKKESDDVSK